MSQLRERRIAVGSIELALAIPDSSARRIARSGLYRNVIRPARRLFRHVPSPERPTPASEPVPDPWTLPGLLGHPDGFLRHYRLAAFIKASLDRGTLLVVGDPTYQMHDELRSFALTYTDLSAAKVPAPSGARYVQGDFTVEGLFEDNSYDVVCSTDTLEHVPAERRGDFIKQAIRVARRAVYIAFPAGEDARTAEAIIRASLSRTGFRDALDEHARHRLPDLDDITAVLRESGVSYRILPLTSVAEWLSSFVFGPDDRELSSLVLNYWAFLNSRATCEPGAGAVYRYLVEVRLD